MRTLKSVIFSLFVTFSLANAQEFSENFGKVTFEELSMEKCAIDNQAEAMVLFDYGSSFFVDNEGLQLIFERITRVKIFSKAGFKYAEIEIPYYVEFDKNEKVYDLNAVTYTLENGVPKATKLKPEAVFTEKINEHWMVKKFAMPDVAEGSVIEYRYRIVSPYFFNFRDWQFQSRIPTLYSQYLIKMIPFYEYCYIFQGASKFDVFENYLSAFKRNMLGAEYPDNVFKFGMINIPAFRDEAFISSINDYIMKIDFQLAAVHPPSGGDYDIMTTWPMLVNELSKNQNFGGYYKNAVKNSEEILPLIGMQGLNEIEKAEAIYNYVKGTYNWTGFYSKYTDKSVKEFLKIKTGNSAEINLFLCAVLNAAGLNAYPVIISTRDHGKIPANYPFEQFLNYVIVSVTIDNQTVLMDATSSLCSFGMLPSRCFNDKGLVVNKEKPDWIPLLDQVISDETDSVTIRFDRTMDSVKVDIMKSADGHIALEYRSSYLQNPEVFKNEIIGKDIITLNDVVVKNENDIKEPLKINYGIRTGVEQLNDKLLIDAFPGLTMTENPLKLDYRNYPVDFIYPRTHHYHMTLDIPEGYMLVKSDEVPEVDDNLFHLYYRTEEAGGKIVIEGSYYFKKSKYSPAEYIKVKLFMAKVVDVFNRKLILQKTQI